MSRIGKRAVPIPSGVTATVEGQTVKVKGPKGALQIVLPDDVTAKMDKGSVKVDPRTETDRARAMWGTSRTLVANLMTGVTKGFESKLEISGITDATDLKLAYEALGHTSHQIGHERTRCSPHGAGAIGLRTWIDLHAALIHLRRHIVG